MEKVAGTHQVHLNQTSHCPRQSQSGLRMAQMEKLMRESDDRIESSQGREVEPQLQARTAATGGTAWLEVWGVLAGSGELTVRLDQTECD